MDDQKQQLRPKKPSNWIFALPTLLLIAGVVGGILMILQYSNERAGEIEFGGNNFTVSVTKPGDYKIYFLYDSVLNNPSLIPYDSIPSFTNDTTGDTLPVTSVSNGSTFTIHNQPYKLIAVVHFENAGSYTADSGTLYRAVFGSYMMTPGDLAAAIGFLTGGILMIVFLTVAAAIIFAVILVSRAAKRRRAAQPFMMPTYYPQPPVYPMYPNQPVYPPSYQPPQPYQPQQPPAPPQPPAAPPPPVDPPLQEP